ncbi:MAG: GTP-binding protein [Candidatus Hodarchaeales archaeon]
MTLLKIALIGDGAVGKTALRERFIGRAFKTSYMMTIGADFATYKTTIYGREIKFQIWDLAGQPRFQSVRTLYYRGTMGALMVYDITRMETFQNTPIWIEECFKHSGKGAIPLILLANKTDLRGEAHNALTPELGIALAKEMAKITEAKGFDCPYFETSAKTGHNVDVAFKTLGKIILDYIDKMKNKG